MPDWKPEIRQRLANLQLAPTREAAIVEELAQHLDDCYAELLAGGATTAEAYRAALAELSENELLQQELRCVERPVNCEPVIVGGRSKNMIGNLGQDLRYAGRLLRRNPGFTAVAVFTLALGIGANSLVFSAAKAMLLRPLPVRAAERLVWIYEANLGSGITRERIAPPNVADLVQPSGAIESVALLSDRSLVWNGNSRPERWHGLFATPNLVNVLGVTPALGRAFTAEEIAGEGWRVMMLGYERWQQSFGGDPGVLGQRLQFDEKFFTVIGVLPRGLEFPIGRAPQSGNGSSFKVGAQDFWIPLSIGADISRDARFASAIAKLQPGATPAQARAAAQTVSHRLATEFPATNAGWSFELVPLREQILGQAAPALRLLIGVVALVLLIACANVANLLLARATAREKEFAIRLALGAGRGAIIRQLLVESLLLGLGGALLGLLLAAWGRGLLIASAGAQIPFLQEVGLDWPVVAVTLALALVASVAFGLAPAWAVAKVNLNSTLQGATHSGGRQHARLRQGLVIGQVALTLTLLIGAGLLLKSFARLMQVDRGYELERILAIDQYLCCEPNSQGHFKRLHDRLRTLPGVEAVGMIQSVPLTGKWTFREPFLIPGRSDDPEKAEKVSGSFVAFDYFRVMGTPLLAGRAFTEQEFMPKKNMPAIIINETAARRFFPGEDALGKTVQIPDCCPRLVVGVVKDTLDARLDAPAVPQWYLPGIFQDAKIMVRSSGAPANLIEPLRHEVIASDPRVILESIKPLDEIVAATVAERRLAAALLAAFAGIALVLTAVGLYGLLAYIVGLRTGEFGIRLALGANRRDILTLVLRQGLKLVAAGTALGLVAAMVASRWLSALLFQMHRLDPLTYLALTALFLVVAVLACYLPARRATQIDPLVALRRE